MVCWFLRGKTGFWRWFPGHCPRAGGHRSPLRFMPTCSWNGRLEGNENHRVLECHEALAVIYN